MNVSGSWEGEYIFEDITEADEDDGDQSGDSSSDAPDNPKKTERPSMAGQIVAFTMDLQQGWLGAVNGTVQDDVRSGFEEPGKIKGKLKGTTLEFRKLMPVLRLLHESGRPSLEKWAERRKIVIDTEQPSPAILHDGTLSADGKTVEGQWRMPETTIEVPGSYMHLTLPELGGTWRMRRKE